MKTIYLATKNLNKISEFNEILKNSIFILQSPIELDPNLSWKETGNTFEENALIKAKTIKKYTDQWVLADDSGLEVEILNNMPGIYSSRFAGHDATYEQNNIKLLQMLQNIPLEKRIARFVCCLVFIDEFNKESIFKGCVEGIITNTPKGNNGFGYDPLFFYPPLQKTFAQLNIKEKNQISHRAQAIRQWKEYVIQNILRSENE